MVVHEKYFDILDKSTETIGKAWKAHHIFLYFLAIVCGFLSSYMFGNVLLEFGENCILYPNIMFINKTTGNLTKEANVTNVHEIPFKIDTAKTLWGNMKYCDYCQFTSVMSTILGAIFVSFFVMWPRGGTNFTQTGIKRPWHLIFPSLVVTGVFSVVMVFSSSMMSNGLTAFCDEFSPVLNNSGCVKEIGQFKIIDNMTNIPSHILVARYALVVCAISWVCSFLLLLVRCCCVADFRIVEVKVTSLDHASREQIEQIDEAESESLIAQTAQAPSEPVSYV